MSDAHFWTCPKCGAQMYGFEHCQNCGASEHMSEYIITTEQIEEAAEYTPPFKTLSYVAKYKVSGDLDMQGIAVHGLPEIVRCRECAKCDESKAYGKWFCHRFSLCDSAGFPVEPNGFCAWGVRA